MAWNNLASTFDSGTNLTFATDDYPSTTLTVELPDPLIDWLPYKFKKYIPAWHIMRSYKR